MPSELAGVGERQDFVPRAFAAAYLAAGVSQQAFFGDFGVAESTARGLMRDERDPPFGWVVRTVNHRRCPSRIQVELLQALAGGKYAITPMPSPAELADLVGSASAWSALSLRCLAIVRHGADAVEIASAIAAVGRVDDESLAELTHRARLTTTGVNQLIQIASAMNQQTRQQQNRRNSR